jgi:hypothetical protein
VRAREEDSKHRDAAATRATRRGPARTRAAPERHSAGRDLRRAPEARGAVRRGRARGPVLDVPARTRQREGDRRAVDGLRRAV